ncbi:MAG: carboxypeptidase-like regulatory domain-containing protein [Bacteroidales bacterium]|nr:carboxypeptidase-like regulatory domain-containing protein [Bacteroidales bacterium]
MNNYIQKFMMGGLLVIFAFQPMQAQHPVLGQKISFECNGCSIAEALSEIETRISYFFSYNPDVFADKKPVSMKLENIPLKALLDTVISDTTIQYSVLEKQVVLYRRGVENAESIKQLGLQSKKSFTITGTIIDRQTQKPVPFANICIVGKSLGSVSNMQGEFVMKVPGSLWNNNLGISFIGYKTYIRPLSEIHNQHVFELETDYIPIQEVIIRQTEPLLLLKAALKKIPENYNVNPSVLTSFYRETIERGNEFMSITESVLETYKTGYGKAQENDQIRVLKGRKSQNINTGDSLLVKLKAGLNTTILLDIVKNPADFLQEEYFEVYDYQMADIISDNDRETYVIVFKQKEHIGEPLYQGRIYIDVKNLAIKNFEFSLSKEGIEKTGDRFVVKKPRWLVVKPVEANYRVSYREFGQKYYLNFVRSETDFRMRKKRQIFSSIYRSRLEMVITDIDTTEVKKFRYREIARPETIFTDLIHQKPETYWEDYNYIKPDESLEDAVKKLNRSIKEN